MGNVISVTFDANRTAETYAAYQYDYGQILKIENMELPTAYEVHFSNSIGGQAITSIGDADGVDIPDQLLATGKPVYFWLYLHTGDSDGETEYSGMIPVIPRASMIDYEPTPKQQDAITQAIEALNSAVESTGQDAETASTAATAATAAQAAAEGAQASAETAATAAETAQGRAESAQTAAETAQTAAETAQGKAEDAQEAAESAVTAAQAAAEESAGYVNAAAGKASDAAESASEAAASATAAGGSATAAAGKASEASASATAATGSATTASTKAGEAATSATNAAASATAANTAKTAAQTAQTAAESARTAAETAAASVSASAAQIETNKTDITHLKQDINEFPFTDSYSAVVITWTRTDKYYSKINGNEVSQNYYYQFSVPVEEGDKFILTGTNDYNKAIYAVLDSNGVAVKYPSTGNSGTVSNIEITIESGEVTLVLQSAANDRNTYSLQQSSGKVLEDHAVSKNSLTTDLAESVPTSEFINLFDINADGVVEGKYIGSSGNLTAEATMCVSDYIPVELNVQYSFPAYASFFGASNVVKVPYFNAEKVYASFATGTYDDTTKLVTISFTSAYAKYIRLNFAKINSYHVTRPVLSPELFMFAKAPYPTNYVPYGEWKYIPDNIFADATEEQKLNPLFRKKAVFAGDSICNGGSAQDQKSGWAGRIGRNNQMTWFNAGISGATFTAGLSGSSGVISETNFWDADYLIIEGGVNDADIIGNALATPPAKFGSYDVADYTTAFANTTYCGAIEALFKRVTTDYKTKKIGVIIAQKQVKENSTYPDYTPEHNNKRFYLETLIKLCEKWGIPYLNLWDGCILNPMNPAHYTEGENYFYTDGQHLTGNGYDYISPIIEAWMKTL